MKKGLGRGLNALITDNLEINKSGVIEVEVDKIEPNKNQPRKYFDKEALSKLSESIKEYGIVQPLIVKDNGDHYTIIAGERRWRSAKEARIKKVPVIVKDYTELEILEIALIENIQRQDLNPVEEAFCYNRLMEEFYLTQEDIAKKVSKSRSYISKIIKVLALDERVQNFIVNEQITMGHGALLVDLTSDEQYFFADKIIEEELSIKQSKLLIENFKKEPKKTEKKDVDLGFKFFEDELKNIYGTKVNIKNNKNNKGRIEIEYYSKDELDRLLSILGKK
ncbi:MAG: ParB/RepB/Spo0J family partition protein [Lachnospirales bacterium]